MKATLRNLWSSLRTSFWFVPTLLVLAAALLAYGLLAADDALARAGKELPGWIAPRGPANAFQVLSIIASSMITVAGVTFSIVIVALSLASSQFGPRLLVNFMRDTGNQVVLGTFVATFVYCLLVLRRVGDGEGGVPEVAVAVGVALALASLGVLIYFFHHVSTSIQAGEVVSRAGRQLEAAIEAEFAGASARDGRREEKGEIPASWSLDEEVAEVPSRTTGYVADVDFDALVHLAVEADGVLRLEVGRGDFVVEESPLARMRPGAALDPERIKKAQEAFAFSSRRGTVGDVRLAVDRVVEVAVRALSPGINDPFTAVACIERLGAGLARLAEGGAPPRRHLDGEGRVRVVASPPAARDLIDRAFTQIRIYGRGDPVVLQRLLEAMALVASRTDRGELRHPLERHAEMIRREAERSLAEGSERTQVERQARLTLRLLADDGAGGGEGEEKKR